MSDEFPPVLFLDLIERKPQSANEHRAEFFLSTADDLDEGSSARYTDEEIAADYRQYLDRFQPFRLVLKSEGNNEPLMWGESYFNRADAEHTARLVGGAGTTVFLRQAEKGNELLRRATAP